MASGRGAGERLSASELKDQLAAERRGVPFIAFRDADGQRRLVALPETAGRLTLGRAATCDVWLDWDAEVSGVHAELDRIGDDWVVADDGLSRNGTFLNDERVSGRRRLRDGDRIRAGRTLVTFRDPTPSGPEATAVAADTPVAPQLSPAQRRVLVALCRPLAAGGRFAAPASNADIGAELFLTVAAVRTHLRALFERFEVEDLPHHRKRLRLAERALETGAVRLDELAQAAR